MTLSRYTGTCRTFLRLVTLGAIAQGPGRSSSSIWGEFSVEGNKFNELFKPLDVGPMKVPNRIVMAPMERNYGNPDGTVSVRTIGHYRLRAEGGVGWIDVEATFVDPAGRGRTHQLGLHEDRCIDGFRALVDAVHVSGAKIGVELHHAGREASSSITGLQPVGPSPVPCFESGGDLPRELSPVEIDQVVQRYADAAGRAVEAGFDAVELHSAHGYLPLAFLSPLWNHRSDEYGGSFENRARFALRVIAAIRAVIPSRVDLGCRFSAEENLEGGLRLEDGIRYAQALEQGGVDYLSVSTGIYETFTRISPPMDFPPGWLLPVAAAVKRAVRVPVIGVSRVTDPAVAEAALARGDVDLVALGRALLTDPEFPIKARSGRQDEIVSCIGCNQGCIDRISRQLDVTCLVNPQVGREPGFEVIRSADTKRVVVVGGGPGGMEVARTCAERGHHVRLYDRSERLGGTLTLAAQLPERPGWSIYLEQSQRRLLASGVDVNLGTDVDERQTALLEADVVVLATGARFVVPLDAISSPLVAATTPPSLFASGTIPTGRALVCGAGAIGLGVAVWLANGNCDVTVISEDLEISNPPGQDGLADRLRATGRVSLMPGRRLARFDGNDAILCLGEAIGPLFEEWVENVDLVVWTTVRQPRSELRRVARQLENRPEVYEVGDCLLPRDALDAVYEGAAIGRRI